MAECSENSKIQCRSKRAITSIFGAINEHIEQIVAGNVESSAEDKEKCKMRFREIYETALQQNVLIDGEEWSYANSQDETSEFEPVNVEKKMYISDELVPSLDTAIVRVSTMRKFHPRFCEEEVYDAVNKKAYYLAKVEVKDDEPENDLVSKDTQISLLTEPKLQPQLEATSSSLNKVIKNVTTSVEKADKLQTAVSIFHNPSKTDHVIQEGLVSTSSAVGDKSVRVNINGTIKCEPKPQRHQDYLVEV